MVPYGTMGLLRTHFKAGFAADAFLRVDPPYIAVFRINICRSDRTILDAYRGDTLPAGRHPDIIREFPEGILYDLYTGERQVLLSIMNKGAAQHTSSAAHAFFAVINQISF